MKKGRRTFEVDIPLYATLTSKVKEGATSEVCHLFNGILTSEVWVKGI